MAGGNSNPLPPSDRAIEHDDRGHKREVRMVMAEARAARLLGKMTGSSSGGTALPPTLLEPLIADNAVTLLQEALAALGQIATTIGDIVERLEELEAILATFKDALSTAALEAELEAEEEAELEAEEEAELEAEEEAELEAEVEAVLEAEVEAELEAEVEAELEAEEEEEPEAEEEEEPEAEEEEEEEPVQKPTRGRRKRST